MFFVQGIRVVDIFEFNEVTIITKFVEILVLVPEVGIVFANRIFASIAGYFIEDVEVFFVCLWFEMLFDSRNQLYLWLGQLKFIVLVDKEYTIIIIIICGINLG